MVRLLEDDHYIAFGQNFETLLHAFDRNMDEVLHAVYENIGWIKIHEVAYNVSSWRQRRVVGTEFEPADKREKSKEEQFQKEKEDEGGRENERATGDRPIVEGEHG